MYITPIFRNERVIGFKYESEVCSKFDVERDIKVLNKLKNSLDE